MPETDVLWYGETSTASPPFEWFGDLIPTVRDKVTYRIERLEAEGHMLRRPEADFLRDGIHELRIRRQRVNYCLLYGFCGGVSVLLHGCTKEGSVDDRDIDLAVRRLAQFSRKPAAHTFEPD